MGHDWEVLNRLHRKGMIDNPVSKAKSVMLTDQGLAEISRLFKECSRGKRDSNASPVARNEQKAVSASSLVGSHPSCQLPSA
jgi:hypothetical protein